MDYPRYSGRELSWLQFNERVLEEVEDKKNPLLEQLRFLSIFSSNLDEYFMIRVSGMKSQIDIGLTTPDKKTGFLATEYLQKMIKESKILVKRQYQLYQEKIKELNKYVNFINYNDLDEKLIIKANLYFKQLIYPILTPIRFSPYLPFPLLPNLSLYLISKLEDEAGEIYYSVVTVPKNVERVVHIKKDTFILLEDIIINNITFLYEGMKVLEVVPFRIKRDLNFEIDDQSDDFAKSVSIELKNRKRGQAIRLEVDHRASEEITNFLTTNLQIQKKLVFLIEGPINLVFLNDLVPIISSKISGLVFDEITPIYPEVFQNAKSIFEVIRNKDVLLFHPHHSYEPVIQILKEASEDPNCVAIKQTIYRTNKDSRIMQYLLRASERGIQVTVLFELKARFDEENNLFWGNELEKSGAHVIYGVPNLKTHSKLLLIVRREKNIVEQFVHFATGNYNEDNAKIYTDASYFTCKKMIAEDATKFFNYISVFTKKPEYKKLIASPDSIRELLFTKIDQEIANHKQLGNGHIILKINAITDVATIDKLYEASMAGVKIDMIIRGISSINPGIPNLSENIRVISIIGRYLEQMRIFYFYNNQVEDIYLSSADLMTRNMYNRIELAMHITNQSAKAKLKKLLKLQLSDNVKARENHIGKYEHVKNDLKEINSQIEFYKYLK